MLSNNTWKKPDKHENTSNISFLGITVNFRKYFETSGADTCKKKKKSTAQIVFIDCVGEKRHYHDFVLQIYSVSVAFLCHL